jgi:hypothetical protein
MAHPLTLWTARAVVACCLVAWLLVFSGALRSARGKHVWRAAWTAGCITLAIHVLTAMHFEHGWSHTAALRHTARQTLEVAGIDWGGGLYFNYGLLLLWTADVSLLWIRRDRPIRFQLPVRRLTDWACAFIVLNATVVFGPSWWLPIAALFGLSGFLLWRHGKPSTRNAPGQ